MTIRSSYGLRRTKDCPCLHVTTGIGHLYRDYHGTQPFQHSDSLQHTCHHLRIGISRNVFFVQADSESTDTLVDSLQHVGHQHSEDDILMESLRDAAGGGHPDTVGVYQHLHHRHRMVVEGSDGASEQLEEVSAANEAQLQNFLKANPELLPIEELELPGPMMVVGAETHVNSGAIDLNQSQSGIYIDTGLGGATNTVFPANAGIQGTVQNVLSWTTAYSGVTKDFAPSGCAN